MTAELVTLPDHLRRWAETRGTRPAVTYVRFPADPVVDQLEGTHRSLTWGRLERRVGAVAAGVAALARPGERAALLLPQGIDYVAAFLACLSVGVIAVPLSTPDLNTPERLAAILADSEPCCVLAHTVDVDAVRGLIGPRMPVLTVDKVPDGAGPAEPVDVSGESVAYLQYTSGSTRTPTCVMISHRNVVANARQALAAFDAVETPITTVGWLPLFHDMGLVLSVAAPIVGGLHSVLMSPIAFLQRPARWLRLLARYPDAVSAAPNFAYEFCASRVTEQERHGLRLGRVKALINGSEPVRATTIERFQAVFGPHGLRPDAQRPSYGLAEATVLVTSGRAGETPSFATLDREALADGKALVLEDAADPRATRVVACGTPVAQELLIADPADGARLPEGVVGEIWVRGPNVGGGYWGRPALSAETFGGRAAGVDGDWLRTGDLGLCHQGALLVAGRLKDLIIVDGRNHYPQDIEHTVQSAVETVRRDHLAAFAVAGSGGAEELVVVAEHVRRVTPTVAERATATREARSAVSARHGLRLADLRLVAPGSIPRTSSGKIARGACRRHYLDGGLA